MVPIFYCKLKIKDGVGRSVPYLAVRMKLIIAELPRLDAEVCLRKDCAYYFRAKK
jgi:hypothetical protein